MPRPVIVAVKVAPLNGATPAQVAKLAVDLLAESCGDEDSDTFKNVRLVDSAAFRENRNLRATALSLVARRKEASALIRRLQSENQQLRGQLELARMKQEHGL